MVDYDYLRTFTRMLGRTSAEEPRLLMVKDIKQYQKSKEVKEIILGTDSVTGMTNFKVVYEK